MNFLSTLILTTFPNIKKSNLEVFVNCTVFNDAELFVAFYTPVTKDHNITEHHANHTTGIQHILIDCRIDNTGIYHVCSFALREFF